MTRKHAIVIGGTKGVGRELAAILAADGQHVTAVGRTAATFPELSGGQNEGFVGVVETPLFPDVFVQYSKCRSNSPKSLRFV